MPKRSGSDYQRRYRQRMAEQGMIKVEVWVPRPLRSELHAYANQLRNVWLSPFDPTGKRKENAMWTNQMLLETLRESEQVKAGDWDVELIQGSDECLVVTMHSQGDLEVFVSASGDQILASVLLWPVASVPNQAEFNAELLRDHKLLPLSTFGITTGPDNQPWYELFGALSTRSTVDSVMTELVTLAENTLQVAEAYQEHLAA